MINCSQSQISGCSEGLDEQEENFQKGRNFYFYCACGYIGVHIYPISLDCIPTMGSFKCMSITSP